jgi:CBS-domain-containing membrane protein
MQARDVMTVNVISVSEESPIHEIVRLLLKFRISAVPVVDSGRKVVGMISESDLLRPEGANRTGTQRRWWLETVFAGQTLRYEQAHGRTAGEVMTQSVFTVDEDTPITEIAELLERHHIKRVPVLRDGRLVGIVSRANLLHGLAHTIIDHHEPGAAKDRQIREQLVKILLEKPELADPISLPGIGNLRQRLLKLGECDGREVKFAADSLLEGDGFEPSVPRQEQHFSRRETSSIPYPLTTRPEIVHQAKSG